MARFKVERFKIRAFKMRGLIAIALLSSLMLLLVPLPGQASSLSLVESKVARLDFDLQRLRNRVDQLSSSLGTPSLEPPRNTTRISQPASAQPKSTVTREEFENLATLVIELKEEVRALRLSSSNTE